jgi:hypothetical protein
MSKIDLIIDTIHELMYSNSTAVAMQKYYAALAAAKELREELTKPEERVCCGDYEKCTKPCTPKGRWQGEQNASAQFRKDAFAWDGDAWGEMAAQMSRDFVERAKKNWEPPPKDVDTITMTELRNTDLYRKVQIQLLRDILKDDNT